MSDRDAMVASWQPTGWWQVVAPDGSVYCETSDENEAFHALLPGYTVRRQWRRIEQEWRDE